MAVASRAGNFVLQPTGYKSFIPAPLPPDPPLNLSAPLIRLLSRADQAVGRLDGVAQTLPNPDLFVAMYVRREAVDSSQIEGTQSTLQDVLVFELDPASIDLPDDVGEVVNYVKAMNYGLSRLAELPLSLRLIREIHSQLLSNVRGSDKAPGEFRTTQNWIGSTNATITGATFVPPPPREMTKALSDFEGFLYQANTLPELIHCGLCHVQFETIHPFLDGNGRVGRLLISFLLVHRSILHRPLLYLSSYLKHRRAEYYDRLMAVRTDGNWEAWLEFFLRGVAETAEEAAQTAAAIIHLKEAHRQLLHESRLGPNHQRLLDLLFLRPLVNVSLVEEKLGVTDVTANRAISALVNVGILEEITGRPRNRVFRYFDYWKLFLDSNPMPTENDPAQETELA